MGVNTFLLDRRTATLSIGSSKQTVGTLQRFFKLTELDDERVAELDAAARITPSPAAALVVDISELPLASKPDKPVAAHLVLGWDSSAFGPDRAADPVPFRWPRRRRVALLRRSLSILDSFRHVNRG